VDQFDFTRRGKGAAFFLAILAPLRALSEIDFEIDPIPILDFLTQMHVKI
jgi:hypothetical protein